MEKYLNMCKCYVGYPVAIFAGWELCKGDWIVAIPALLLTAYFAYTCGNKCCKVK